MDELHVDESLAREKEFQEAYYTRGKKPPLLDPSVLFESPAAFENKFIMKFFGELKDKKIVDMGAGTGESSVYFALKGAQVTWTDISESARLQAETLARKYNVIHRIQFITGDAEQILRERGPEEDDFVYGSSILHHIKRDNIPGLLFSALKKNGKFAFIDPLKYNPLINVYRAMADKVRSPDERPLGFDVARRFGRFFNTAHREFWLAGLIVFIKFYLLDGVHPNEEPYWKKIFYDIEKCAALVAFTGKIDAFLARISPLNYLCWNTVIYGEKT